MKLNNAFSADNVIHISDKIHRYGKYTDSDYESDEPIHYEPGYGVNSYSSDEILSKKTKEKGNQRKMLPKKLQMQNIQKLLAIKAY